MSFDFHRCLFEVIEIGIFNRQHMESLKQNHVWQKKVCGSYRYGMVMADKGDFNSKRSGRCRSFCKSSRYRLHFDLISKEKRLS